MKARGKREAQPERVAPGQNKMAMVRPEGPEYHRCDFALSGFGAAFSVTQGDAFRCASRLPLAFIFPRCLAQKT